MEATRTARKNCLVVYLMLDSIVPIVRTIDEHIDDFELQLI